MPDFTVEDLVRLVNTDKLILQDVAEVCFRRCVSSYQKEHLNHLEQNCVDRCVYKYNQMLYECAWARPEGTPGLHGV